MRFFLVLFSLFISPQISAQEPIVVPLWENGAPGFEDRKDEPEEAADWWVRNIHNPSANVFLANPEIANGTAVVIFPGGGHMNLVYNSEGVRAANFFNSIGVTAIVIKYRLAREEGSPYELETHNAQDAHRGVRIARAYAEQWGYDPNRIGIVGFSAGGETAALVAYGYGTEHQTIKDSIDKVSSKPNFQVLVYPGPLFVPDEVNEEAPSTFGVVSTNDECCSEPIIKLLQAYREAGVLFEAHIYAHGDHAFNMGTRSELAGISSWSDRLKDWMSDSGLLDK
ncbi:MAG: alpha/beta hydrolase [Balneolaceae bacterium]